MQSTLTRVSPLFLLPTFFVLHEYYSLYPAIPVYQIIAILCQFIFIAACLFILSFLIYRKLDKAAIYGLLLLFIYVFFGALYDFMKRSFGAHFFTSYIFIIPFLLALLILIGFYIKRRNSQSKRFFIFTNLLFIILIAFDFFTFLQIRTERNENKVTATPIQIKHSNQTYKPDIYLIIADEYAGLTTLKEIFEFDNSKFVKGLQIRNFHFLNQTTSNYNATIFSMASMLNLGYLKLMNDKITLQNTLECSNLLNENVLVKFLQSNGYAFHNFSPFDVSNQSKAIRIYFFPTFEELFISQTITERIRKDIGYNFMSAKKIKELENHNLRNDSVVDILTRNVVKESVSPKFVYTHFNMPHHPFFINKDTNSSHYGQLVLSKDQDKRSYINYLEFANKKLLDLIDFIKKKSANPPIILLMSDHGWRGNETSAQNDLQFANINAIHLPDSNYKYFYDGMSNVNQMRMLLNTYFAQNLSRLADTTIFLKEVVNQ